MPTQMINALKDKDGNAIVVSGGLVVDKTTGATFEQHITDSAQHLSSAERAYMTNAGTAGGVALLDANGYLPSSVIDTSKQSVEITVATIEARDALTTVPVGGKVFVEDATGDSTVKAGWAIYRCTTAYAPAKGQTPAVSAVWFKIAEGESLDLILDYANLINKPVSSTADIDASVGKAHGHDNSTVLSGLSADGATNNLLFNGKEINGGTGIAFVGNAEDSPVFTGGLIMILESYTAPIPSEA